MIIMKPSQTLFQDTVAAADSLAAMIEKEHTIYKRKCSGYLDPLEPAIVTADDRMAIVDWCYSVVDHCQFSREAVAVAMDMVDRYLSVPSETGDEALRDQHKFQLLSVTALYVAIKVNEAVAMSSDILAEITHGVYTVEEIEGMELTLLSGISWRCNAPNGSQVGLSILSVISSYTNCSEATWGFLMDEMKYLTELAVRDYYFSTQRASTIALATIFNALGNMRDKERQELLQASLCILECFDFDEPKVVLMVSKKLQQLLEQENHDHDIEGLMDAPEAFKCIELSCSPNSEMRRNLKLCISMNMRKFELHREVRQSVDVEATKIRPTKVFPISMRL